MPGTNDLQALRCHTNTCPTGVTTQDKKRAKAIAVKEKGPHVRNYQAATMESFLDMLGAMGLTHPDELTPDKIYYRLNESESLDYTDVFHYIKPGSLLGENIDSHYKKLWEASSPDHF